MNSVKNTAQEYITSGLSVIPLVGENSKDLDIKKPAVYSWGALQKTPLTTEEAELLFNQKTIRPDLVEEKTDRDGKKYTEKGLRTFTDPQGLGIITGSGSGSLEVIDVDTKHDTTGTLWDSFKTLLEDNLEDLYPELVIARTRSGGYHIYYRCREIGRNIKLSVKENREVLIETRGEGGYVVAPPTAGYEFIQGSPGTIPEITPQKREVILTIARSFNEVEEEKPRPRTSTVSPGPLHTQGLTPWEDYDNRGDIIALMESHGWRVVSKKGENINLLRPGKTDSKTSGSFHTRLRTLYIFSTSTVFENKGYTPSAVFSLLECGGDYKLSARRLRELGYGDKLEKYKPAPTMVKTETITVSTGTKATQGTTVISTPGDTIKIEDLRGDEVVITSPGPEATAEVLRTLEMIAQTRKRTYIKEGDNPIIREYEYKLQALLDSYDKKLEEAGDLSTQETDSLLDEVVKLGAGLDPLDRDQYRALVMAIPWVKDRGITQESYQVAVDRLTTTREKENRAKELSKTLYDVKKLQEAGNTEEALETLKKKLGAIETTTGQGLLPRVLSYSALLDEIATLPTPLKTGYPSLNEFIGFTPGAISLVAGRPGHGKTTLLFNFLLDMAQLYPEKVFYFFTYEEPLRNLSVKLLNRLTATDLSPYYRTARDLARSTNYEFLKSYIKAGRSDIVAVENGKRRLRDLIDGQRIRIVDRSYPVEDLHKLILYLTREKREDIGAVFIDYIQRMSTTRRTQDKRTEIAHISDMVLQIAKDSGLPIILGAQFRRKEGRGKPSLDDLKEAGNLEEDANTVIRVWNQSREDDNGQAGEQLREVDLEITALKNREGEPNQSTTLTFDKWTGTITDPTAPASSGRIRTQGEIF
jgi:replicative DNA helicase